MPQLSPRILALDLLKQIEDGQFDEIVFRYPVPREYLPGRTAARVTLATSVIQHAENTQDVDLSRLLDLIHAICPKLDFKVAQHKADNFNPYRGLAAFQADEAHLFFGRETVVAEMLDKLRQQNLVALIGASGSGKSSLVFAGLFPQLQADYVLLSLRPKTDPLGQLAFTLAAGLYDDAVQKANNAADLLAKFKAGQYETVPFLLQEMLERHQKTQLLLVVDQFEELYALNPEEKDAEMQRQFTDLLLHIAASKEPQVRLLLTLRADFLGRALSYAPLAQALDESAKKLLGAMQREALRAAVEQPALYAGVTLMPTLVTRILDDVGDDPGQLPLLQFALTRLWEHGTDLSAYERVGGVKRALVNYADEVLAKFKHDEQAVQRLFVKLVQPGRGQEDTRHVALRSQMEDWDLVRRLADKRLLVTGHDEQQKVDTVEVVHESLIRHWQPLRNWMKDYREFREWQERLRGLLETWQQAKQARGALLSEVMVKQAQALPPAQALLLDDKEKDFIQRSAAQLKRLQRLKVTAIAALLVLTLSALLAGGLAWQQSEKLQDSLQQVKATEQQRSRELFDSQLTHAALLSRTEDYTAAQDLLAQTQDRDILPARRHARDQLAAFANIMGGTAQQIYTGADAKLISVAISPDTQTLAAAGENGTLVLFQRDSGDIIQRLRGHEGVVQAVVFEPQGAWLASAGDDAQIRLWQRNAEGDWQVLRNWQTPDQVWAMAVSPDGKLLASGGRDNNISLWHPATGELLATLRGHQARISDGSALAFSPDGQRLVSGSYDDTARVWDVAAALSDADSNASPRVLGGHRGLVLGVTFSPDGNFIATASYDKRVILWDTDSGQPVRVLSGHQNAVFNLRFIAQGRQLVSASFDRSLRVWDVDSGVTLRILQGHEAGMLGLTTAHIDGREQLFSAANDGTVRRWDAALPQQGLWDMPESAISAALFPDGSGVAVGFSDGSLRGYALPERTANLTGFENLSGFTPQLLWEVEKAHNAKIKRLAFSPDGKLLASGDLDHTAKVWDMGKLKTGSPLRTASLTPRHVFDQHRDAVHAVAFSPDGNTLATASYDGQIGLFSLNGSQHVLFTAHDAAIGGVSSVSFDVSGKYLLSAGFQDHLAHLWNITATSPSIVQTFKSQDALMWTTLSPNAQRAAAVGRDAVVRVHSLNQTTSIALVGHEQTVYRAIFSSDGALLATAAADATVRLWDVDKAKELFKLELPTNSGYPVPLWDFDFRCVGEPHVCRIVVPLTRGKLAVYELGRW